MTDPIDLPTVNNHNLRLVADDGIATIRVQSSGGHNRAVAKLDIDRAKVLHHWLGHFIENNA